MTGIRVDCFPTSIWHFDLNNFRPLNQRLLETIYRLKEKESQSVGRSCVLGWHSNNKLHQLNVFEELNRIVINNVLEIAKFQNVNLALYTIRGSLYTNNTRILSQYIT